MFEILTSRHGSTRDCHRILEIMNKEILRDWMDE